MKLEIYQRDVVRYHLDHRGVDKHRKFGLVRLHDAPPRRGLSQISSQMCN